MESECQILRRAKTTPDRDALHTFRIGFLIFILLWLILPTPLP